MKNSTKKKIINRKKNSRGGFTLIELLAVVAVLSIVGVIGIYTVTSIINDTKSKSYKTTINNIQKEANTYVLENNKDIFWLSDGSDNLYQCVIVQNLIDMGYFKSDVLDSKVSEDRNVLASDYVYIEKDKTTKSIVKQVLLYDDNSQLKSLCGEHVNVTGNIYFSYPSGWAQKKEVTIKYELKKDVPVGNFPNYKYSYKFEAEHDNTKDKPEKTFEFTKGVVEKKIIVHDEGTLNAKIDNKDGVTVANNSVLIDGIDTEGPNITESASDSTVRGSVTIPITIEDSESGFYEDNNIFTLSNFEVSIGNDKLSSNEISLNFVSRDTEGDEINYYNYNLTIENYNYAGEVKIKIFANQIFDIVGNVNNEKTINTGVTFTNEYTIEYKGNGGIWNNTDTWSNTAIYGENYDVEDNFYTRNGYTFIGWTTKSDGTDDGYDWTGWNGEWKFTDGQYGINDGKLTLYARWEPNTYTISYTYNGGTKGTNAPTSGTYDSVLTINNPTKTFTVNITNSASGTLSATSASKAQTFAGWTYSDGNTSTAKYGTSSSTVSTSWSTASTKVTAQYFKNLRSTSGTVKLTANWTAVAVTLPTITKTGYTCGYTATNGGTKIEYASGGSYTPSTTTSSATLYTVCIANTYTISYTYNGGEKGTNAPTSGTYDKVLTINNPTKTFTVNITNSASGTLSATSASKAQTFAGWTYSDGNTSTAKYGTSSSTVSTSWSTASTKVTAQYFKNLRSASGTVKLTANWTAVAVTLPTITKTGYTCGYTATNGGTKIEYASGGSYTPSTTTSSATLYTVCIANKVYINYNVNGGTLTDGSGTGTYSVTNSLVYKDSKKVTTSISYGGTVNSTSGLPNYNYATNYKIEKDGYIGIDGAEWICLSGCTTANKTFDQDVTTYKSSDFCDASNGNCTVVLGVNWKNNNIYKAYKIGGSNRFIYEVPYYLHETGYNDSSASNYNKITYVKDNNGNVSRYAISSYKHVVNGLVYAYRTVYVEVDNSDVMQNIETRGSHKWLKIWVNLNDMTVPTDYASAEITDSGEIDVDGSKFYATYIYYNSNALSNDGF